MAQMALAAPPAEAAALAAPRRGLVADTLIVSVFSALAKVLGAVKAVAIANIFGSGASLDAYLLAFLIPSFLADVFCGSLVPALVPRLVELDHSEGRAGMMALYARALHRGLILSSAGGVALASVAGLVAAFGQGFSPSERLTASLVALMAPMLPLAAAANVWRAVLNAQRKFAVPALALVLTPVVMIGSIFMARQPGAIWILAVGTTLAFIAEVGLLGVAIKRAGFPALPRALRPHGSASGVRMEYSYLAATAAVGAGGFMIGQSMAAALGVGSVSILNYGTRLAGVLMAIGPAALSVTILPRFSELAATRDWVALRRALLAILAGSAVISGIVVAGLIVYSASIVRLALERGAFTAADTHAVSAVQIFSLLQLPFVVGITILMRVFAALRSNRVLLPLAGATLLVNALLNFLLMKWYGVPGIAMASSIAQALLFLALAAVMFRRGGRGFLMERQ